MAGGIKDVSRFGIHGKSRREHLRQHDQICGMFVQFALDDRGHFPAIGFGVLPDQVGLHGQHAEFG